MLPRPHQVQSFGDLEEWFADVLRGLEQRNSRELAHAPRGDDSQDPEPADQHCAAVRGAGDQRRRVASDLPWGDFADRTVYVIDVANLEEDAQDLIFARVVSTLRKHLERRDLGVDHVIVFVDELNKYAPGDGPDTYVRKMLLDIAERGRYLGLVLFGAQQFRSQVHRRVVGNAGTAALRADGWRRARNAGICGAEPGDQDQARDAGEGPADGAASAFHAAGLRALSAPAGAVGAREGAERFPHAGGPVRWKWRSRAACARSTHRSRSSGSSR